MMATRSAAEARLDAAIRPEIAVLRSRTSYPARYRAAGPGRAAGPQLRLVPAQRTQDQLASQGAGAHRPAIAQPPATRTVGGACRSAGRELPRGAELAPAGAGGGLGAGPLRRPGRAGPPLAAQGRLRLTRRGRVVLAMLGLVAAVAVSVLAWLAVAGQAHASSHVQQPGRPPVSGVERVVVRPGDTLWSIAVRAQPSADPRAVIAQISEINALASPAIQAGEVLWVPAG
jgi:LysM domain